MIETLLAIFTGGGAVGLGSIFKMIAGFIDSLNQKRELREHRKILQETERADAFLAFQKEAFGSSEGGLYSRHTRRMLALIGVSVLGFCTIHCTILSDQAFVTLGSVASGEGQRNWSLLFGAIKVPLTDKPLSLTLGHAALLNYVAFQMILGYYFTPGGRK